MEENGKMQTQEVFTVSAAVNGANGHCTRDLPENTSGNSIGNKIEERKSKRNQTVTNINILLAEFLGTGLLLFLGCMGCISDYEIGPVQHYMPNLTFGLVVMTIIQMFGHISGAHLNPAVTLATVIFKIVPLKSVPFYLVGQFAGGIFGTGALKLLIPKEFSSREIYDEVTNTTKSRAGFCVTTIHPKIESYQAAIMETVITFVLILICCAIWDKRNKTNTDSVPLRFGFVISTIAIAAGPFTGASMNTARSFGPALLSGDWDYHWIYWVAPTLGSLIASLLYKYVFSVEEEEETVEQEKLYQEIPLSIKTSEKD